MKKETKPATHIFHIQIGDNELVNMDTLSQEKRDDIKRQLYRNLVLGMGAREVKPLNDK